MFDTGPQERWNAKEAAEFEKHAANQLNRTWMSAVWAGGALLLNILCIVPFSKGHALDRYRPVARYLVYSALAVFWWLVLKLAFVWSSWQSARETRREFGDPY